MTGPRDRDPWFVRTRSGSAPAARLFLFPHAGGGASAFRGWQSAFPPDAELCAVQLPGREDRFTEPPYRRLAPLLDALADAIAPLLDVPFAFFGHSMGAAIAFELARRLRDAADRDVLFLALSAYSAPHGGSRPSARLHALADDELVRTLEAIGGMPPTMLETPDLLQIYLPVIRADFELCETWVPLPAAPLGCEIVVLGGLDDERVDDEDLAAWRRQTTGRCDVIRLPGGHFYTVTSRAQLLALLASRLRAPFAASAEKRTGARS
jgi:surfactin synthase thioesterase subunit